VQRAPIRTKAKHRQRNCGSEELTQQSLQQRFLHIWRLISHVYGDPIQTLR
jgi:hypothetical protein